MMQDTNRKDEDDDEELNTNHSTSSSRLLEPRKDQDVEIPFCGCLSVRFYQPYFDVDTEDVLSRILNAIFYCQRNENFLTLIGDKPDAYGPIWISTTLVFIVAVVSNISGWLSSWMNGTEW